MKTTMEQSQITTPSDREIRVERVFNAPRDQVWRAYSDPKLVAQWWGRGNKLDLERFEFEKGGRWRIVERSSDGVHGFEGRFREIKPMDRITQTFEYDGMPGHVSVETAEFQDLGDGRTRVVSRSLFHTAEERDAMLNSGMEQGMNESYAALDQVLAKVS